MCKNRFDELGLLDFFFFTYVYCVGLAGTYMNNFLIKDFFFRWEIFTMSNTGTG